jgi:ATP-binding cassette subfamily C protein
LFGNIRILLLDEPNTSMDREGEKAIIEALQWAKNNKVTCVFTTHKLQMITAADKVLALNNGMAVSYGSREEVMGAMQKMANA